VSVDSTAAIASMEAFYPDAIGSVAVRYPTRGPTCPSGQLEAKTFAIDGSGLTDHVAFTVLVP
jgi:hypothetical protein